MPKLQLQTKADKVDDGVSLSTTVDEEPLTFRAPRTAAMMNRPKPIYRPGHSAPPLCSISAVGDSAGEQSDLCTSPESASIVRDAPLERENLVTSNSAVRGILRFTPHCPPRQNVPGARRVRFPDDGPCMGRVGVVTTTLYHHHTFFDVEAEIRVKSEEDDPMGPLVIASADPVACVIKTEPVAPSLSDASTPNVNSSVPRFCGELRMLDIGVGQVSGSVAERKKKRPFKPTQLRLPGQLQAYSCYWSKCRRCTKHRSHLCRVLYRCKRNLLGRTRLTTKGTMMRVKRGLGGCCAASCSSKGFFVKILEVRRFRRRILPDKARKQVRGRAQNQLAEADVGALVDSAPTVSSKIATARDVPSITITTAAESRGRCPANEVSEMADTKRQGNRALNDLLKHAWKNVWKCEVLHPYPDFEMLRSLRSLAHSLLEQTGLLRVVQPFLQDWEHRALQRLRDLLKDIISQSAVTKLVYSEVSRETWQSARAKSLRKLQSIKKLPHETLNMSSPEARSTLLYPTRP